MDLQRSRKMFGIVPELLARLSFAVRASGLAARAMTVAASALSFNVSPLQPACLTACLPKLDELRPRRGTVAGLIAALLAGAAPDSHAAAPPSTGPIATVATGRLEGTTIDGVSSFRNIPFAKPPVGELRWRAPQPVRAWRGTRDATRDSYDCAQAPVEGIAAPLLAPFSEDCLYLNVWKPTGADQRSALPVMVWIHGGGFVNGGISPRVFDGRHFARRGIVMVSINYRLGRFGFFAHPALSAADKDHGLLGNYGLMDQIAALEWVRRNIGAFGGDPRKVTVFGESAGGLSVNMLLTMPRARNLFSAAIVQSGGGRSGALGARALNRDRPGMESLEALGVAFARSHGIAGTAPRVATRLRRLPTDAIVGGLNMFTAAQQAATYGGPSVDGVLVEQWPDAVFAAGNQARVPLMIGATSGDLGTIQAPTKQVAFDAFGSAMTAAREAFDPGGSADDRSVIAAIGRQIAMIEPARLVARAAARQGQPVFAFRFSYVAAPVRGGGNLAAHASDVPFAIGTVVERYGPAATAADVRVGHTMNAYWANFARTGDPNGAGLDTWPNYDAIDDVVMEFGADGRAVAKADPLRRQLDLVEAIQPRPAIAPACPDRNGWIPDRKEEAR